MKYGIFPMKFLSIFLRIGSGKMDYSDMVYVSCNVPERAMINKDDIF